MPHGQPPHPVAMLQAPPLRLLLLQRLLTPTTAQMVTAMTAMVARWLQLIGHDIDHDW